MFTWISIHEEAARHLLEFKERSLELVSIIRRMHEAGLVAMSIGDRDAQGNEIPLTEIDPFTFLANLNRGIRLENRIALWEFLKTEWALHAALPEDFDGLPVANKQNARLIPWQYERDPNHVPDLWAFYEHIISASPESLDSVLMERCLGYRCVGLAMLTMGMFWACPKKWIAADGKNLSFAKTKGIGEEPKTAAEYISWLPQIRKVMGSDAVDFSRQAHLWAVSQNGKKSSGETEKIDKNPWWQKFFDSMEQGHAAFDLLHEACIALGVRNSQGVTSQRVSLTNVKLEGRERIRLICGNTLVLEIMSSPSQKPNACFVAHKDDQTSQETLVGDFFIRTGKMHGLYRVDLAELLNKESATRKMFFRALGDVSNTYSNIKKRHFESAHRPRLLHAAFHNERRSDMLENGPTKGPADEVDELISDQDVTTPQGKSAKNLILYGPPGTGKTYSSIDRALEIIDPELLASTTADTAGRKQRKARFDELLQAKRIGFVTFHQSFSYEDFVEGLKASTDEKGQVKYEVEDGIFKQMCSAAAASISGSRSGSSETIDLKGRAIWKMSLGNTLGPDSSIYNECIENGYVLLGWGQDIDFTGASTRDDIKAKVKERKSEGVDSDYTVTACHAFVNTMKPGDLIIVSDGNHKFRAIGVVKGDYRFLPVAEDREQLFQQCRDVEWVRTYFPSLPSDQLMTVAFSQMSLYRLKPPAIDLDLVQSLLSENEATETGAPRPFVLIIDEINRGNISRVFGELITLVEDSKRAGEPEALSVKLPYSKEMFSVPSNLHLIGTMNTADRSLAQVDIALRRRFVFEELMPDTTVLKQIPLIEGIDVARMLTAMNSRIEILYDREHTIGHAFFISLRNNPTITELEQIFVGKILPLLEEYFFEDWEKIRLVLGDHQKPNHLAIIQQKYSETQLAALFGHNTDYSIRNVYQRNQASLKNPACYVGIYEPTEASAMVSSPSDL
jgi:5-methylcytosine-specific restriction protein B